MSTQRQSEISEMVQAKVAETLDSFDRYSIMLGATLQAELNKEAAIAMAAWHGQTVADAAAYTSSVLRAAMVMKEAKSRGVELDERAAFGDTRRPAPQGPPGLTPDDMANLQAEAEAYSRLIGGDVGVMQEGLDISVRKMIEAGSCSTIEDTAGFLAGFHTAAIILAVLKGEGMDVSAVVGA